MKSFSELTSASQVNNGDLLAISQTSGSGYASKKTTVKDITDKSNLNLAEEYDSTSTYAVDDYVIYESVLYKCIGTTTGTFDSTKWTSVVVTDEMGSGGGGGTGGHTIIDENGNSMTARAGLQFFGAVEVRDDNANNRTLVEVLGGDFYNPVIYSTEEREIGVWTDGKPLYQKTFIWNPTSTETTIDVSSLNIDKLVKRQGTFTRNSSGTIQQKNLEYRTEDVSNNNYGIQCEIRSTNLLIRISAYTYSEITEVRTTLQYTKTTDTAGSGSWTPQGVPTHHYSTDEHIIGTWVDGKTLYEKTVYIASLPSTTAQTNYAHNINNIDKIIDYEGTIHFNNATNTTAKFDRVGTSTNVLDFGNTLAMTVTDENIAIIVGKDRSACSAYITIQYTKSS